MFGAIIGDIVGSVYEFNNIKTKEFSPFIHPNAKFTDDTVCTVAVLDCLLNHKEPAQALRYWCERYWENGGWGKRFARWLASGSSEPYGSAGNGAAMRVSACAWLNDDFQDAMKSAMRVTVITHDHPEGLKGALSVCAAIFSFRQGADVDDVKKYITETYGYDLTMSVSELRNTAREHSELAEQTVPEALICALEAHSFEDAIRNAVSIGGDSDTIAAIAGSIAEARFQIPVEFIEYVEKMLPEDMLAILRSI